jgi:hypothetical protein
VLERCQHVKDVLVGHHHLPDALVLIFGIAQARPPPRDLRFVLRD